MTDAQKKDVFVLIDKKDKMGDDDFTEGLRDTLNDADKENQIKSVFVDGYTGFINKSEKLDLAIAELNEFIKTLELFGVKNAYIDLSIARGLAYYTGLVFEFKLLNHPELGTAAGGGRYADLAGKFSKTKIIGVGAAIGFSRIFVALMEAGAIDLTQFDSPVEVSVLCMGTDNLVYSVSVLNAMRDAGVAAVAYLDADKKFKNQIEYADKIKAKFSVIIGEDEAKSQMVAIKDMQTGNQQVVSLADAIKMVKAK